MVELLGKELGWDAARVRMEKDSCIRFLRHFGGAQPVPGSSGGIEESDMEAVFGKIDAAGRGFVTSEQVALVGGELRL